MPRLLAALLALLALPALAQEAPRPAKLTTLTAGEPAIERRFYGRVRARETVDLAFQVGGQITEIAAPEGEPLAEGALIARLDLAPFRRQLAQARLRRDKAERDLERLESLSSANVSEVRIQDARTEAELARLAVAEAEDALDDATLAAPFDALVARRLVAAFSTVSPGQPVVRLHDMSELRVDIDVPEVLFRRARSRGLKVWAAFPGDETRHPLALREFEAETAEVGQTYRLTLAFRDNPGDWVLPGASATVTALAPASGDVVVVPESALVFGPDRAAHVMVFEPSSDDPDLGTVALTPVTLRILADGRPALESGPPPGAEIVAAGAALLEDGQRVRRFSGVGQ